MPRAPIVIALNDRDTWPQEVRDWVEINADVLRNYEFERKSIDARGRTDIIARVRPAENRYAAARAFVLRELTRLLADTWLIGYHCTRLEEDEIRSIMRDGLQPLTSAFLENRVKQRLAAGSFPSRVGERLLGRNSASAENRQNQVWFIFTSSLLRDQSGVGRLLGSWGGEALYRHHENDVEIGAILRRLGTACIVEAEVASDAFLPRIPVSELVLRRHLHEGGVELDDPVDVEGYVKEPARCVVIRRVIRRADADFERLTRCSRWNQLLT